VRKHDLEVAEMKRGKKKEIPPMRGGEPKESQKEVEKRRNIRRGRKKEGEKRSPDSCPQQEGARAAN